MILVATIAAILNMAGTVAALGTWARAASIVANLVFVAGGIAVGEVLVWAPHLSLIPLNTALLIGGLGKRST